MLLSPLRRNRAILARQLLLARSATPVDEAVRAVLALQAQEPASVYLALWARVEGLEAEDVDRMLAAAVVVRATLMRVTLHAVHRDDHRSLHRALTPTLRAARLNDRRFRATTVTPEEADTALAELLAWADGPRTNGEAEAWLAERGVDDRLLDHEGEDGRTLLDVAGAPLPPEDTPAPPRLLPMWDSVLFAHEDRTWIIDDDIRGLVIRRNGDTLPSVLVDGRVVGVWRPGPDGDGVEVTTFRRLADEDWEALAAEARSLLAFVGDRDPRLYWRYRRWWDRLPDDAQRLVLEAG
jgi:hypothetical protein